MKKKIVISSLLLVILLLQTSLVGASQSRVEVMGGLYGIIEDEQADFNLNPAQLYNVKGNKIFFDTFLHYDIYQTEEEYSNDSTKTNSERETKKIKFDLSPTVIYQLKSNNKLGVKVDYNQDIHNGSASNIEKDIETGDKIKDSETENNREENSFIVELANAIKLQEDLILGGRIELVQNNYFKEEIETDNLTSSIDKDPIKGNADELYITGGGIYNLEPGVTIDGAVTTGVMTSEKVDYNVKLWDTLRLNARVRKKVDENEKAVVKVILANAVDFYPPENSAYKNSHLELEVGKTHTYKKGLLAYSLELNRDRIGEQLSPDTSDPDKRTSLRLKWGIEREVTNKLTLRAGDSYILYGREKNDEESTYEEMFMFDSKLNFGLSYKLDDVTTIDLSWINIRGRNQKDKNGTITKDKNIELKASVIRKF